MAKPNRGKEWEDHVKSDWKLTFKNEFFLRLKDDTSGYRGSSKNPCDFIAHVDNTVFMLEAKCCYENTFNFSKLTQYDELITYKDVNHTRCAVILWFIDWNEVLYIDIKIIEQMKKDGLKSVNIRKLGNYEITHIPHTTPRVFPRCDYSVVREYVFDNYSKAMIV